MPLKSETNLMTFPWWRHLHFYALTLLSRWFYNLKWLIIHTWKYRKLIQKEIQLGPKVFCGSIAILLRPMSCPAIIAWAHATMWKFKFCTLSRPAWRPTWQERLACWRRSLEGPLMLSRMLFQTTREKGISGGHHYHRMIFRLVSSVGQFVRRPI